MRRSLGKHMEWHAADFLNPSKLASGDVIGDGRKGNGIVDLGIGDLAFLHIERVDAQYPVDTSVMKCRDFVLKGVCEGPGFTSP